MHWSCLDENGELVAIVEADDDAQALAKGKILAPLTAEVVERPDHERAR